MVRRDVKVTCVEFAEAVLGRKPNRLIPVSDTSIPALDLPTNQARSSRCQSREDLA
jgi:hypothetical protein